MSNLQDIREKKVPVQVGEKTYNLFFDMNAVASLEEKYGSVDEALGLLRSGKIEPVRFISWVGFLREHEALTLEQVGAMFDLSQVTGLIGKIYESLFNGFPEVEETQGEQGKNEQSREQE